MAIINIYDSPFAAEPVRYDIDERLTVEQMIDRHSGCLDEKREVFETYNIETGETTFTEVVPTGYKAAVLVGNEEKPKEYLIRPDDTVTIILIPESKADEGTASVLEMVGAGLVVFGSILATCVPGYGTLIGAALMVVGLGLQLYAAYSLMDRDTEKKKSGESLDSEKNLSISGAGNKDLTDNPFPLVLGKHLIAPYIIGSPYCTTYTKDLYKAEDGGQYVTALYMVGYGPLRLTDFKIDQTVLAYNRVTDSGNGNTTVMHGQLHGYSSDGADNGDILRKWKNNDVTLEILQAGDMASDDIQRYGKVYPQVCEQIEVDANLIRIHDGIVSELSSKVYKGTTVPNGFMTNSVRFSRACPMRIEVEVDFPNGLYATRSKSSDVYYYNLPVRLAVQWRYVKNGQPSSDAESPDGWFDFDYIELKNPDTGEETHVAPVLYTAGMKAFDYNSSLGKSDNTELSWDDDWINRGKIFRFGAYGEEGSRVESTSTDFEYDYYVYIPSLKEKLRWWKVSKYNYERAVEYIKKNGKCWVSLANGIILGFYETREEADHPYEVTEYRRIPKWSDGTRSSITSTDYNAADFKASSSVNERRYVIVKNFTSEECRKIIGLDKDADGNTYSDLNCVEVRVLRINPSYLDEEGSKNSDDYQNMKYQDLSKWTYLRTFSFDKDKYKEAVEGKVEDSGYSELAPTDQQLSDYLDYKKGLSGTDLTEYYIFDDLFWTITFMSKGVEIPNDVYINGGVVQRRRKATSDPVLAVYPAVATYYQTLVIENDMGEVGDNYFWGVIWYDDGSQITVISSPKVSMTLTDYVEVNAVYNRDGGYLQISTDLNAASGGKDRLFKFIIKGQDGWGYHLAAGEYPVYGPSYVRAGYSTHFELYSVVDTEVDSHRNTLVEEWRGWSRKDGLNTSVDVKDYPLRPLSQEDMDKACIVALTLKQDVAETGGGTLKQLSCIAESLAPKYSETENQWYPRVLNKKMKYWTVLYDMANGVRKDRISYYTDSSKGTAYQQYMDAVNHYKADPTFIEGKNARQGSDGNDLIDQMKAEIFTSANRNPSVSITNYNETLGLLNRNRLVSGEKMVNKGWTDITSSDYATVHSVTYLKSDFISSITPYSSQDCACVLTPILKDGTVLTPNELEVKASSFFTDGSSISDCLMGYFSGSNSLTDSDRYAVSAHIVSDVYFNSIVDMGKKSEAEGILSAIKGNTRQSLDKDNVYTLIKWNGEIAASDCQVYYEYFLQCLFQIDYLKGENYKYQQSVEKDSSASSSEIDRYYLSSVTAERYVTANTASMALLSLTGRHLGKDAKTYSDINMDSFTEFYEFCTLVTDGTMDTKTGKEIEFQFNCNGVVSQQIKLESLFQKILYTGRANFRRDDENKYEIVIGKAGKYPVALISRQNTFSISNSRTFEAGASGFHMQFIDESDNYGTNDIYVMADGEDYKNPTGNIEELQIPYVTERNQLWSLGRSNLGVRLYQRESYSRTVGKIGYTLSFGDIVLIQDDTLLIGTDNGGRVRELIQDERFIYGFVSSEPFHCTGEETVEGSGVSSQGVTIIQPQKSGSSRCVTMRLAMPGASVRIERMPENTDERKNQSVRTLIRKDSELTAGWRKVHDYDSENYEKVYTMCRGLTNVVLFANRVFRATGADAAGAGEDVTDGSADVYEIVPKIDNLIAFGTVGHITSKAVVNSIKHVEGEKFQLGLVPYEDRIYRMGGVIPEFDANMTQPGSDGITFSGAVTQDDINNTTASAIKGVLDKLDEMSNLYQLDLSPEYQTVPVSSKGLFLTTKNPVIGTKFYEGSNDLTEGVTYTSYINDEEGGEWVDGVLTVPLDMLLEETNSITVIAQYGDVQRIRSAQIVKMNYGEQQFWYDMLFPDSNGAGAGAIHATHATATSPVRYFPSTISVEKKKVSVKDGDQVYEPTDYGTIEVEFYDRDGNRIDTGKTVTVGGYAQDTSDVYSSTETYIKKYRPITLKLSDDSVLAVTEGVAAVFYEPVNFTPVKGSGTVVEGGDNVDGDGTQTPDIDINP